MHPAEGKAAVVGGDGHAEQAVGLAEAGEGGFVGGGDGAEEQVAVAADVLGKGLNAHVDAEREGVEVNSGGPGIVERDRDVAGVRGGDERGEVGDLHGDGAGGFGPEKGGCWGG